MKTTAVAIGVRAAAGVIQRDLDIVETKLVGHAVRVTVWFRDHEYHALSFDVPRDDAALWPLGAEVTMTLTRKDAEVRERAANLNP